jgi:hypothetical protein
MSIWTLYLDKRRPAMEAMGQVRDGDFIVVPTGVGEPPTLLSVPSHR